ncbi:MAG: hypothetical protein IK086_05500 [Clostridia bacterium]|nr:hypothetical protein [Clostridia bacterium]
MAKYCAKCNAFFEDNEVNFCAVCGSSEFIAAQAAPVEEAPTPEVHAAEAPAAEAPAAPLQNASAITIENPAENAPRKKSVIAKILLIAIPVVLAALIAFNFQFLYGWALRVFGSDASYLKYVETKSVDTYAGSIGDALENYTGKEDGVRLTAETKLKIGKEFNKAAKQLGGDVDISWLDGITVTVDESLKGGEGLYKLMLAIDKKDIVGADIYFNKVDGDLYVLLKELSDKVLHFDTDNISGDYNATAAGGAELSTVIMEALPDSDTLKELICKYVAIALDDIDEVSSKSETVTVGDISQKLLVIEYKISEKTVMRISRDVLKELKEDPQVAEIVNNLEKSLRENGLIDESDDLYDELIDEIDATLEEIDDEIEDASNKSIFTVRDYVDAGHKIVGRELASKNADETLKYIVVEDGGKYAAQVNIADETVITGSHEKKDGVINGDYDIKVSGKKVATIKLIDLNVSNTSDAGLSGTIRITPDSKYLKKNLDSEYASVIAMLKPALEFEFETGKEGGSFNMKLLTGGKEIIGIYTTYSVTEGAETEKPEGELVNADDSDALEEFIESIDLSRIIDNLRKTSIPKEYIDAIEAYGQAGIDEILNPDIYIDDYDDYDYYDDYYDDYDDYDDDYYDEDDIVLW